MEDVDSVPLEGVESVEQIQRLADAGRADDANALALALLARLESAPPPALEAARAANRLGAFFSARLHDALARRALACALRSLHASGAHDDALLGNVHNNLGQLDQRAGDLASAQEHLEQALALKRSVSAHPVTLAYSADNLAAVLSARGDLERAEALHREALATFQAAGPRFRDDVATALGNLGQLYRRRHDLPRARAFLLRALDLHLREADLQGGNARYPLANLIELALESGDEALADEFTDMLLRAGGPRIGAAHHPTAVVLLELASAAFARFQLASSERLAQRALSILEVSAGPTAETTLRAVRLLANVHAAKGNGEAAEQGLLRALNATPGAVRTTCELLVDLGKAVALRGPGSTAAAARFFEDAIAALRPAGRPVAAADKPLLASALGNLARLYADDDQAERAYAVFDDALALGSPRTLGGEYPWLVYSRALLDYHLARHDAARSGMHKALRLWTRERGAAHPFAATVLANLALVHWACGRHRAAQRALDRAAATEAVELERRLRVGTEAQRLETARQMQGDLFKRITLALSTGARGLPARSAAQLLLQRKGAVLDALALTQARLRERLDDAARERFDRLGQLRRQIADAAMGARLFGAEPDPRTVLGWRSEEERLERELSHEAVLGSAAAKSVTLDAVQSALPPGTALLELVRWTWFDPVRRGHGTAWGSRRYAAMLLLARGAPKWVDLGEADALERSAMALRSLLRDPDSDTEAIAEAAAGMHERLLAPLEAWLAGCRRLVIAPDGELNLLPWGVLARPGQPLLFERFVIDHVACGRELLAAPAPPVPHAELHAFVDPDFDACPDAGTGPLHLEPLPATREEAAALQAAFSACVVHAGGQASVEALRALRRPVLLHIATHGLFSPPAGPPRPVLRTDVVAQGDQLMFMERAAPAAIDHPMLAAGLALAGANASQPGRPVGWLSAAEIAGLDLLGTELAVLSACDTGLGVTPHGDEFAGLRRAFAIAGAASQVISLWAVDDAAAGAFMREYYPQLAAGAGRAEALQRAQVALRRRPRFAHPSAWAAFAAWGRDGPLPDALLRRAAATGAA